MKRVLRPTACCSGNSGSRSSRSAAGQNRQYADSADTNFYAGVTGPVRSNETLIEMIYEAHIKPGWLIAPYFQYVFRPSGGIADPNDPTGVSRIGDAAVFGVTTTIRY
ncbi:carbohydrate porin [Bradyrhizobium manausense]|uniref:carbohydrate porin n=1 Tax=Bradyrhizobium manausense TaxID=989370 RepID=UPI002012FA84|nr:carbohydrate porin [Bradyrhizobium manausense]